MSITRSERPTDLPPPRARVGVLGWLGRNLFASPLQVLLTLATLYGLYLVVVPLARWLVFDATWRGTSLSDCAATQAACWPYLWARLDQILYGFYPEALRWRVDLALALGVVTGLVVVVARGRVRLIGGLFLLVVLPIVVLTLLAGGVVGLVPVAAGKWGGLTLTLVISFTAMATSLPAGIVLALGRRSRLTIVRGLCVAWIELWRGVPMLAVLFVAVSMFPLFMPEGFETSQLVRALAAFAFVMSAFIAEAVRGGLQAVPRGQYEAAEALGLGYARTTVFVVLPQALRLSLPAIVNNLILLFKDSSLVQVIGLFDLLGIVQLTVMSEEWISEDVTITGYFVIAGIYWAFCFAMSRYGLWLERRGGKGAATGAIPSGAGMR